jgi:PAS domain S-box-containing protein
LLRFKGEDFLQESEQRFRGMFEEHQAMMLLVEPKTGTVVDANPSAGTFFGQSREQLRSLRLDDLGIPLPLSGIGNHVHAGVRNGHIETTTRLAGDDVRAIEVYSSPVIVRGNTLLFSILHDVTERKRMEKQILEISESEQQRLGRDLHDALGQHLTATAFMAKALAMKLAAKSQEDAPDAAHIVLCVNHAILTTRHMSRGLCPIDLASEGLIAGLKRYTAAIKEMFGVTCLLTAETDALVKDESTIGHCYRIVQEAVNNAIRHGKAEKVEIQLAARGASIALTVRDYGRGLPKGYQAGKGMGLHTMRFRAHAIGGQLTVESADSGGTLVSCIFPKSKEGI